MKLPSVRRPAISSAALAILGFTALLTAAFVGVVSLFEGGAAGLGDRVPFYVLAMAVVFVAALWILDSRDVDGITVLVAVSGISVGAFVLISLAAEGVAYAADNPGEVFTSDLFVYFVAAALICTGLGAWILRHWREFTATRAAG